MKLPFLLQEFVSSRLSYKFYRLLISTLTFVKKKIIITTM